MHKIEEYDFISEKLKGLDVAILVINAGVSDAGPFEKLNPLEIQNMIAVNVSHVLYTTKVMTL